MKNLKGGSGDSSGYGINGGILRCIEMLLAEKKVLNYIDWQEKNPQMMIVLKIYVRQMFEEQEQLWIEQSDNELTSIIMQGNNPKNQDFNIGGAKANMIHDLDKIQKKITLSEMVDDDMRTKKKIRKVIEESHDVEYHERQNFFNGMYSTSYQKILQKIR